MINLTVLEQPIKEGLNYLKEIDFKELSPIALPVIIFIIIRIFAPNAFKFCWDMIRNK